MSDLRLKFIISNNISSNTPMIIIEAIKGYETIESLSCLLAESIKDVPPFKCGDLVGGDVLGLMNFIGRLINQDGNEVIKKWQNIDGNNSTQRLEVEGGFLYSKDQSICFVPAPAKCNFHDRYTVHFCEICYDDEKRRIADLEAEMEDEV